MQSLQKASDWPSFYFYFSNSLLQVRNRVPDPTIPSLSISESSGIRLMVRFFGVILYLEKQNTVYHVRNEFTVCFLVNTLWIWKGKEDLNDSFYIFSSNIKILYSYVSRIYLGPCKHRTCFSLSRSAGGRRGEWVSEWVW